MSFEKIVEAARNQSLTELNQAINEDCIDVWKPGVYFFSAASQLALEKNIPAVNFLMDNGANINYVAFGAGLGGHRAYVNELLQRGANIGDAARGAALGGHREYANELLRQAAGINYATSNADIGRYRGYTEEEALQWRDNIDNVAYGAGSGGHREHAQELMQWGASIGRVACGVSSAGHRGDTEQLLQWGAYYIDDVAYGAAFGGHRKYTEELLQRGADINNVAEGASSGGHRSYAEKLLQRGANINDVAYGAALGGHREYAEELLQRGAYINIVAEGANAGGHTEYVEELLERDINIDALALRAGLTRQRALAEKLLQRGADINNVMEGANVAGFDTKYVEELLRRGADIDRVAEGETTRMIILDDTGKMAYLSSFSPEVILRLINAFKKAFSLIQITDETQKRSIAISNHIHKNNVLFDFAFHFAFIRTDPNYFGILFLLMKIVMKKGFFLNIPTDIWEHIFRFLTPAPLVHTAFKHLGFIMGRSYLSAQLFVYQKEERNNFTARAKTFYDAVISSNNKEILNQLVVEEANALQDDKEVSVLNQERKQGRKKLKIGTSNQGLDKYPRIIGFWKEEIMGVSAKFEKNYHRGDMKIL